MMDTPTSSSRVPTPTDHASAATYAKRQQPLLITQAPASTDIAATASARSETAAATNAACSLNSEGADESSSNLNPSTSTSNNPPAAVNADLLKSISRCAAHIDGYDAASFKITIANSIGYRSSKLLSYHSI
ncbi:unnamed protein product [Orchesella dallaii]|uniref:Uncharacterized protein n=1 Tax=Orchesella dallaii TaxID=48710 RepID=A0ABP1RW28_9HEXA